MEHFLYILKSKIRETYYIGISADPETRCFYHNNSSKGYTQRFRPWEIVFTYSFETKQKALTAEAKVKSWKSKKMIRLLVEDEINLEDYLN